MKQNLRFGLVLGRRLAALKISSIKLKYATFEDISWPNRLKTHIQLWITLIHINNRATYIYNDFDHNVHCISRSFSTHVLLRYKYFPYTSRTYRVSVVVYTFKNIAI